MNKLIDIFIRCCPVNFSSPMVSAKQRFVFSLLLSLTATVLVVKAQESCPYTSFTWVAHQEDNPYFWKSPSFGWNATSTIAVFGDITDSQDRIDMRDYAHSIGVSVITATSPGDIDMGNDTQKQEWINQVVTRISDQGLDGVNVDYEGHDPRRTEDYNDVTVELCDAMHESIPGSKVSIDVPIYPEYEGRNYDYARMASSCDSLFVMGYDGEFWDNVQCTVTGAPCSLACASLQMLEFGIQKYLEAGVPASKLVLGVPWYGLKYEYVLGVPFFTGQLHYKYVLEVVRNAGDSGKMRMDEASSTWVFDCGGKCSQWSDQIDDMSTEIWYDDPTSLAPKYALATKYGLQGVGMWESTHVDYDPEGDSPDADAMWDSLCQRG